MYLRKSEPQANLDKVSLLVVPPFLHHLSVEGGFKVATPTKLMSSSDIRRDVN